MISSTRSLIDDYALKTSLGKDDITEVNRSYNELTILERIYVAENDEVKKFIDKEMLNIQQKVRESRKGSKFSSWLSRWGAAKTNVVSLAAVWHQLADNASISKYKCLVK
jgi:hypothetical protein